MAIDKAGSNKLKKVDTSTVELSEEEVKKLEEKEAKRLKYPGRKGKVDTLKLIYLYQKGLNYTDIAEVIGNITPSGVKARLERALGEEKERQIFELNKANYLELLQKRIYDSITDDEIKKMRPKDKIVSIAILNDKIRLERNLSTENIASISVKTIENAYNKAVTGEV